MLNAQTNFSPSISSQFVVVPTETATSRLSYLDWTLIFISPGNETKSYAKSVGGGYFLLNKFNTKHNTMQHTKRHLAREKIAEENVERSEKYIFIVKKCEIIEIFFCVRVQHCGLQAETFIFLSSIRR